MNPAKFAQIFGPLGIVRIKFYQFFDSNHVNHFAQEHS